MYLADVPALPDRVAAALAHAGRDGIVTGWAGCVALGLPYVVDAGAVPVLVPAGRRRVTTPAVRVLPTTRPPSWWRWTSGVRVAAPARCVIDAARGLRRLDQVRALVLGAAARVTVDELSAELVAGARGGRALVARALRDATDGAASCPEAELAELAVAAARAGRLPSFLLNPEVHVRGELLGRPDGWFPGRGVGWEVDSREHHAEDDAFDETLARHDRWLAHGLSLLHVTPRRLRRLGPRYADVLAAAAAAGAGRPEPAGLVVVPRGPVLPHRH